MTRVAILSPSLTPADAVGNDVLHMSGVLSRNGYDVRMFSESHSLPQHTVYDVERLPKFLRDSNDVLIYHFSRGWDPGVKLIRDLKCRRVIRYHNVTPARFFIGFSRTDQELCERGRQELTAIIDLSCELYLSASAFSMQELIDIGADASRSFVVPPFHHIDSLANVSADQETLTRYSDDSANIVSVGRIVPHKCVHHLVEAFAHYHYNCNKASRLIVVGKGGEGLSLYSKFLNRAVQKLGLTDAVIFTGGVSDAVLKAHYQMAAAFVTTSEHEGFCVPLVEAMAMKLPITAYASTAIPETLGDAGIVWTDRNPLLIAESLDRFVRDSSVSKALGLRGQRRYESNFTNAKIERTFLQALAELS